MKLNCLFAMMWISYTEYAATSALMRLYVNSIGLMEHCDYLFAQSLCHLDRCMHASNRERENEMLWKHFFSLSLKFLKMCDNNNSSVPHNENKWPI